MTMNDLLHGVAVLVRVYEDTLFTAFCIMLAFAIALGVKRVMLD